LERKAWAAASAHNAIAAASAIASASNPLPASVLIPAASDRETGEPHRCLPLEWPRLVAVRGNVTLVRTAPTG
jgi:hypothetical protein